MGTPGSKFQIIQEVLSQEGNLLTVSDLCRTAGVSRSEYYNWLHSADARKKKEAADLEDFQLILDTYRFRGYDKGARGIQMRLLHLTPPVVMNIKKIRRLMNKYGLFCPVRKANPYRRMAKALRTNHVADNLVNREFEDHDPRKVLLTDITYIPYNGRFCYLSTILDAFTKQILSYVLSESLELDFVLKSVEQLVERHGISLSTETLIHSGQGCHYTSYRFIQIVKDAELCQSMSRRGNCWDIALPHIGKHPAQLRPVRVFAAGPVNVELVNAQTLHQNFLTDGILLLSAHPDISNFQNIMYPFPFPNFCGRLPHRR